MNRRHTCGRIKVVYALFPVGVPVTLVCAGKGRGGVPGGVAAGGGRGPSVVVVVVAHRAARPQRGGGMSYAT